MDQNFRTRLHKTLYSGELEHGHSSFALTDLAVEFFQGMAPHKLGHIDLESASAITGHDGVSPASITMSMMYAKRLQRKRPEYVMKMSSSELFIISMMMASKYLYDEGVDEEVFNDEWAENAGLEKKEINDMELDFLHAVDWELFIHKEDFDKAMFSIERQIALKEGMKRGWFSYTDLNLLMDEQLLQLTMSDVGLEWFKVVMVSSATYLASVMMMVGSTILVTNASLALATTGLLPALYSSFVTVYSPLTVLTSMHLPSTFPLTSMELQAMVLPPELSGFNVNCSAAEEENDEEGRVEPNLVSDPPKMEAWESSKSVLDTILSQLVTVLTLKSHLLRFVSAVSDSYASSRNTEAGNRSSCRSSFLSSTSSGRLHPAHSTALHPEAENGDEESCSNAMLMSQWILTIESDAGICDLLTGSSCSCGSRQRPSGSGCDTDCKLPLSGSAYQECLMNQFSKFGGGQGHQEWSDEWQSHYMLAKGCLLSETIPGCCSKEDLAFLHNHFPDITVGFSTSMPPVVYAT